MFGKSQKQNQTETGNIKPTSSKVEDVVSQRFRNKGTKKLSKARTINKRRLKANEKQRRLKAISERREKRTAKTKREQTNRYVIKVVSFFISPPPHVQGYDLQHLHL